jgi:hypothetical protein
MDEQAGSVVSAFAGYLSLRSHLVQAASVHLGRFDPTYVDSVRSELARDDVDPVTYSPTPLTGSAAEKFARFRRLLNATCEVELYFRQVNAAVVLLALPGAHDVPDELAELRIQPSEQFFHHLQAWSMSLGSLFERVDNLVTLTVRQLMRPTDTGGWRRAEARHKAALKATQDRHRALRNSFAHQGGIFDGTMASGVWEEVAAAGRWLDTDIACHFIYENRVRYVDGTTRGTATAVREL